LPSRSSGARFSGAFPVHCYTILCAVLGQERLGQGGTKLSCSLRVRLTTTSGLGALCENSCVTERDSIVVSNIWQLKNITGACPVFCSKIYSSSFQPPVEGYGNYMDISRHRSTPKESSQCRRQHVGKLLDMFHLKEPSLYTFIVVLQALAQPVF